MELSTVEKLRLIAGRKGMTIAMLAERSGQTRQNLSNKLSRANLQESELRELAKALDCSVEIVITDNVTGEKY